MGTTAKILIESAARKIGVLGRGSELSASEQMDWLIGLKQMLDQWSAEQLMIPFRTKEEFTFTGATSLTIGNGGDLDTVKPVAIDELYLKDVAGQRYELTQVPRNAINRSNRIAVSGRPRFFTFERGHPLASIIFDRIPYDPKIVIWSRKPISAWQLTDLDVTANPSYAGEIMPTSSLTAQTYLADIEFEVGYELAIVFNLAVVMASDYDVTPSPLVVGQAATFKRNLLNANLEVPDLSFPAGLGGPSGFYDIVEGPGD